MDRNVVLNKMLNMNLSERRKFLIDYKRKHGLYKVIDEHGFTKDSTIKIGLDNRYNHNQLMVYSYSMLSSHKKLNKELLCKRLGISRQVCNRSLRTLRENKLILKDNIAIPNFDEKLNQLVIKESVLSLPINATSKILYSYLLAWNRDVLNITNSKISSDLKINSSTIAKYLKELVDFNLINVDISTNSNYSSRVISFR